MISRVADHCFWLGRYLERAEGMARLLFVTRNLSLDAELSPQQCWHPVLIVAGEEERFAQRYGPAELDDGEAVQHYLTWDAQVGIQSSVAAARENARSIREVVSLETWEAINELHVWLASDTAKAEYEGHRYSFYRHIRQQLQLCLGVMRNTMLHDNAFDFISLGVMLERGGQTARILDVHYHAFTALEAHQVVETALWLSLLRACSGFEPFMKRHQGAVTPQAVARFLVLERRFPRTVLYCLDSALKRLRSIRPPEERQLPGGVTLERLHILNTWLVEKAPDALDRGEIHDLLVHVVDEIDNLCTELGRELLGYGS